MFRKLLGNLPFNPSLINQVAFYAKRVHHEASIRRLSFVLMVLAMMVQLFAVVSPPQPSLALSSNDIIAGGFSDQNKAVKNCTSNDFGFKDVLENFKITCQDIKNASTKEIKANDYGDKLYAVGRKAVGNKDPGTNKDTDESAIRIKDVSYYGRKLSSWDKDNHKKYKALVGKNSEGKDFAVLYNCGGVAVPEKPKTPPPPPVITKDKCPNIPGIQTNQSDCRPCDKAQNASDSLACLSFNKTAKNITQKINSANGSKARGGDVVEYTLTVRNGGKVKVSKYLIQENLGDVLEYANLTKSNGGTLDKTNLRWPAIDLAPGQAASKTFSVQIKNPIPNTPVSRSDPNSYDLIITTAYGNAVNIKLPASPAKSAELAVTTLPDTGSGTSLLAGFILTTVIGYFFFRNRLIAKELDVVRHEFNSSGGY